SFIAKMQLRQLALCLTICLAFLVTTIVIFAVFIRQFEGFDTVRRWYDDLVLDWFQPNNENASADLVDALPGLNRKLKYRHYSGYLESIDDSHLFYWFYESQSARPSEDPVVLWLNGGPGCSSLFGALSELGPLRVELNG